MRTLQYGTPKVQTTVRIPEHVLVYLKKHYIKTQWAIDALVIEPVLEIMKAEYNIDKD